MDTRNTSIPYEIRHQVFRLLSADSLKSVRLACKEWMLQVEHDGFISPVFDDRLYNNSHFCYGVNSPKSLTISHISQVDEDFFSWTYYVKHLCVQCPIQCNDFLQLTNYLTRLELSGGLFSEHKLSWKNSTKVVLPCLKVLIIKVFFPSSSTQNNQMQRQFLSKTIARDIKELIMLANLKIILQSLKTPHLGQFEYKSGISNRMTLIGETEESEEDNANAYDKQWDTKDFICKNLNHLRTLKLDFLNRVYLDNLYLSPAAQLTELSYKLHDSQSRKYDEKLPMPEYFWNQLMEHCKFRNLRIFHFESFRISVPLEKLMNQFETNLLHLEEFSYTGKLHSGSNVLNVRGNPIEVKGVVKMVDRVSCTIFENMLNLKKIELRLLKHIGYVQLLHLYSLPPAIQHISIKDTIILPTELPFLKKFRFLKTFTYSNSLSESFNSKSHRIFYEHIQSFLQMRCLQRLKISPIFSDVPIKYSDDGKSIRRRKKAFFWGKKKVDITVLKDIAEIDKVITKKQFYSYVISL